MRTVSYVFSIFQKVAIPVILCVERMTSTDIRTLKNYEIICTAAMVPWQVDSKSDS